MGASRTARHRQARQKKRHVTRCEWHALGSCSLVGLDVAHVDGDDCNNADENLLKLCRSHHRLLDLGLIDPAAPRQPGYRRTGADRKRRYLHVSPSQSAIGFPDQP